MSPMREIRVGKVTLNIGFKEAADVEKGKKLLSSLTDQKIVITKTKKRSTFGPPKGRAIGVMVTLRGRKAADLLARLIEAKEGKIKASSFDGTGNFSFGIEECINIPGLKYDPEVGILGMDVCVTLERPGYSVARRRMKPAPVGKRHRITKEEAMEFAATRLGMKVME